MYDWLTFTYDENNTYNNYAELPEFIRELKARGIHFVQSVVSVEVWTIYNSNRSMSETYLYR